MTNLPLPAELGLDHLRHHALYVTHITGHAASWHSGVHGIFGWTESEWIGRPWESIYPEEDAPQAVADLEEVLTKGEAEHERYLIRRSGERFLAELRTLLITEGGSAPGVLRIVRDRTRQDQDTSMDEHEQLILGLEAAKSIAWNWDLDTGYTQRLGPLLREFGLASGPASEFLQRVHPHDIQRVRDELERAKQSLDGRYDCEFRLLTELGEVRWMHAQARVVRENGQPVRIVGIAADVTQQHQQRVAIQTAARQREEFIATLAHELRNPLAPIRTGLQILQRVHNNASVTDRAHAMIERQLGYLVHMIDDLVDINRIKHGGISLRRRRLPVRAIIDNAVETSREALETAEHTLRVDMPSEPLYVEGDLTRLVQVLTNLLVNAAKYTARGGVVELTVRRESRTACICVTDNGVGLTPEAHERVFEMFTRETGSTPTTAGLGIGLALARALVQMHDGSIDAASPGLGRGSTFTVRLPLLPASPEAAPACLVEPGIGTNRTHRILVVDDNIDSARSLETLLHHAGHEVRCAFDGKQALEVAEAFQPRFVLLDIGMPGMNGHEVAQHLRSRPWCSHTILIAMSGWGQAADRIRSQETGIDYHWVKPIDIQRLEQVLNEVTRPG